ncbi:uncharacterized protein LODBEIA_P52070 [Lodderomyces beijingensis]|uniref:Cytochrome P450 n=1 Tax=Lodderomyces beijingensis TaxID=1775926 RepID=A0ABP0ZTJ0_9ASCO
MLQTLVFVLGAAFFIFKLVQYSRQQQIRNKYNCKPCTALKTSNWKEYFGLDVLVDWKKDLARGLKHHVTYGKFQRMQVSTFKHRVIFRWDIMTTDPENLRHMKSSANFKFWNTGDRPQAFEPLMGDGIFSSEGASWKHSRVMLRPFFNKENIKHITMMEPFAKDVIRLCQRSRENIDLQQVFHYFTMDYTTKFLMGESCDSLKDALDEVTPNSINKDLKSGFASAFDKCAEILTLRVLLGKKLMWLTNSKKFQEAVEIQHSFVRYYVQKAIAMDKDELDKNSDNGTCFLYEIAKHTKDPKVLQDEIMNIILAGRNTTASLLSMLFFELSREENKHVWHKLNREVRAAFPSIESITFESINRCEYLKWCLYEMLRFNPAVPVFSRTAATDTILPRGGGKDQKSPIFVAKGQVVIYAVLAAHRNAENFGEDPDTFSPERFAEPPKNGAFMPFGFGPRLCLGQQLAMTEASYLTIIMCLTFSEIEKVGNLPYPPRTSSSGTQRLMDGCRVRLK